MLRDNSTHPVLLGCRRSGVRPLTGVGGSEGHPCVVALYLQHFVFETGACLVAIHIEEVYVYS